VEDRGVKGDVHLGKDSSKVFAESGSILSVECCDVSIRASGKDGRRWGVVMSQTFAQISYKLPSSEGNFT